MTILRARGQLQQLLLSAVFFAIGCSTDPNRVKDSAAPADMMWESVDAFSALTDKRVFSAIGDFLFPSPLAGHRSLQTDGSAAALPTLRDCNAEIGRITLQEMLAVLGSILQNEDDETGEQAAAMLAGFSANMKYDVSAYKVCGSCQELEESGLLGPATMLPAACNAIQYGYDAMHSALVLIPVDPESGDFVQGSLRGVAYFHGTSITVNGVPTETWPASLDGLQSGDQEAAGAILGAMFANNPMVTSAGAIVIAPDYLGYGQSLLTHNRTYVVRYSYEQAAIVSWLTTQNWIKEITAECTQLENTATISGVSEGGYAALAASTAMGEIGVRILNIRANTPALSLEDVAIYSLFQYDNGLISPERANSAFTVFLPLAGFAYSSELPALANTGTQTMLAPDWMVAGNFSRHIPEWLESPDPISASEIYSLMPPFAPDIFEPGMISLLREGIAVNNSDPCSNESLVIANNVDTLCQALVDNDMTPVVANIAYPTEICYSENDTVIPPFAFKEELFQNSFVTNIRRPNGAPLSDGDHAQASIECMFHDLVKILGSGLAPGSDPDELPFLITALPAGICASTPTQSPAPMATGAEPTMAPVVDTADTPAPSDMPTPADSPSGAASFSTTNSYAASSISLIFAFLMIVWP